MRSKLHLRFVSIPALFLALAFPLVIRAQSPRSRVMVTQPVNDNVLHRLAGNTRSQANARNDAGPVADDLAMEHMLLQLQRPPEQEQAVQQLIESQQEPQSPNYHRWLTAAEVGAAFGPAQEDIDAVTGWLKSHGFTVNSVYPSGMTIDFSGTAGQVQAAFHTAIHQLSVNGVQHIANMSDPMIPEALAPVVAGVVSLHDFMPHTLSKPHKDYTFTSDHVTNQAVTPADLATIYNLTPLFTAGTSGISGQGQTIAVVEDSDLYNTSDWNTFRSTFGLSASYPSGSLTTVHPAPSSGANNCSDPGTNSDDVETTLDAEWASAAAPNAAIQVATCADTRTTFGGLIAVLNLLSKTPPAIISMSYGECEAENGATANAAFNKTFQQAVVEGVSVFVAAGDEGAASCDAGESGATHGIGVSGYASTPYNVAVGGTDFSDTYAGSTGTYWSSTNSKTYESALSYIPEIPWNDSCAGSLLAKFNGSGTVYGTGGFCSSSTSTEEGLQEVVAGSGGPSGCATGSSATGVVSGSCAGYAKPRWQTNATGDGVRDIPDVSLFAGNGLWGHFYVFCFSDIRNGGARCTGAPSTWAGAGGTSFASPIMAGIQALVNQKTGERWGNPNIVYYAMATGSAVCNSSSGNAAGSSCIFYNVTEGDNVVNCSGTTDCYGASTPTSTHGHHNNFDNSSSANGELSTSSTSALPAYGAISGWNFATGIGSVNAANLVNNWHQ
jgi:subtilase family serine protease